MNIDAGPDRPAACRRVWKGKSEVRVAQPTPKDQRQAHSPATTNQDVLDRCEIIAPIAPERIAGETCVPERGQREGRERVRVMLGGWERLLLT
jgi:hypothetical protein